MSMQTTQAGDLSIDRPIMPAADRVPAQWKPLINNAEWETHKNRGLGELCVSRPGSGYSHPCA